jgi:hypothetical protein
MIIIITQALTNAIFIIYSLYHNQYQKSFVPSNHSKIKMAAFRVDNYFFAILFYIIEFKIAVPFT